MFDPREPRSGEGALTTSLEVKLASLVVHGQEFTSPSGHSFDLEAMKTILADPEVNEWLATIPEVLLPVKRTKEPTP